MSTLLHPLAKLHYVPIALGWSVSPSPKVNHFTGSVAQDKHFLVDFSGSLPTSQPTGKIIMQWKDNILFLLTSGFFKFNIIA